MWMIGGVGNAGPDLCTERNAANACKQGELVQEFLGEVSEEILLVLYFTGFGNFPRFCHENPPSLPSRIHQEIEISAAKSVRRSAAKNPSENPPQDPSENPPANASQKLP